MLPTRAGPWAPLLAVLAASLAGCDQPPSYGGIQCGALDDVAAAPVLPRLEWERQGPAGMSQRLAEALGADVRNVTTVEPTGDGDGSTRFGAFLDAGHASFRLGPDGALRDVEYRGHVQAATAGAVPALEGILASLAPAERFIVQGVEADATANQYLGGDAVGEAGSLSADGDAWRLALPGMWHLADVQLPDLDAQAARLKAVASCNGAGGAEMDVVEPRDLRLEGGRLVLAAPVEWGPACPGTGLVRVHSTGVHVAIDAQTGAVVRVESPRRLC